MDFSTRKIPILALGEAIANSEKSFLNFHKPNQRINTFENRFVYFLKKGNVATLTNSGGFVVFNNFAPDIIGLESLSDVVLSNHLRCISNVEMHVISKEDFIELLHINNLWANAFHALSQYLYVYHVRDMIIHQPTTKDTITHYIRYIWSFNKKRRDKISIYTFISSRTYLARSSIHKVVADLEALGEISTKRGILLDCKLPPLLLLEEYVYKD